MKITNNQDIDPVLAVWLLHDEYDYDNTPNYISATRLLRPLKHIVMAPRVPNEVKEMDVADLIARSSGSAFHAAIERAWTVGYERSLKLLGYPEAAIKRILINPEPSELKQDSIPVYIEQRVKREIDGFVIGGKFDMCLEGQLRDNKSTSAYTWLFGGRDDEHKLQGSVYRWLNPKIVTEDTIRINYIFTDWQKQQAKVNPKYPQKKLETKDIKLMSLKETEEWIRWKLALITKYAKVPESQIPECTDEELWRSAPKHQYFSDPKNQKATKNFDDLVAAKTFMMNEKGGKGVVKTTPGEVKRCTYCDIFPICHQKDRYFNGND